MDKVTKSYLEEFRQEQSLSDDLPEPDLFEFFAIYCAVSNSYDEEFDPADVRVGGGNDLGIDGIAIIVNGALVDSIEEAEDLLNVNGFLDVKFVFLQAKSSSNFSGQEIAALFDGVKEYFADNPTLPVNEGIAAARESMVWLYSKSVKFKRQKPTVELHYVTTGQWTKDEYLVKSIEPRKKELESTQLFASVTFHPYGANELQAAYQRSKNNVTVEFNFESKVLLPDIEGVKESYLGVLPSSEYLSLISDEAGNIRKPLFYDNVRDFQGNNEVNKEIKATLDDPAGQQRFVILNNGVTVVARGLQVTRNKFAVTDYHIVNGCQTSHVLYNSKDNLGADTYVPIKVVSTNDEEIINSIITSTNRQTQVTADDLFALSAFQKKLEALYQAYPDKKKLHYERRSKQYASVSGIEKVRIIDKKIQVRAFAAMFLDDAHRAARYYSDLRAQVGTKIINDSHKLEPYYVSAYAYYKLEYLFRNSQSPVYYKPARYHLLMALRYLVGGDDIPAMTANKVANYANKIAEVLWSDQGAAEAFKEAVEVIISALGGQPLTRDLVKTQTFTDAVKAAAKDRAAQKDKGT